MLTLKPITADNFYACLALTVHESQQSFVASNVKSLAEAWLSD